MRRAIVTLLLLLGLAGCSTTSPDKTLGSVPWLDQQFDWQPALVTVDAGELFRLPPDLKAKVADPTANRFWARTRLRQLAGLIFGPDNHAFGYASGHHSTVAAETWANRRGDCLSLTVLTYALAREMGLNGEMQEVQSPMTFDRVGRFDVLNEHVNVFFKHAYTVDSESRDVVIDFDPDINPGRRGKALDEQAILARYYNNIAVEHLAHGRFVQSYAHFRAALHADPNYAAAYGNLAVLYRTKGHEREAEQLLRAALAIDSRSDLPLRSLHQLLVDQGRAAEAQVLARELESRRSRDPYYWTGVGIRHLQEGQSSRAVSALERARDIAPGFVEIRRYLALAYARTGDQKLAQAELKALGEITQPDPQLATFRKKILQQ